MRTLRIAVDDEFADAFIVESIKQSLDCLDDCIVVLKKNKKPDKHCKEELKQAMLDFEALKRAYNYYGGKTYVSNRKKVRH